MKNTFLKRHLRKSISLAVFMQMILMGGDVCHASDTFIFKQGDNRASTKEIVAGITQQSGKKVINGKITDDTGEVIIGATVRVKGTSVGVITDVDGKYMITVPDGNAVLVVSFIGYQPQEVEVKEQKMVNVRLRENVQSLDEVTVVAYGVQKKATLTGAISSIGTEALLRSPSASVSNALAGQLTGVSSIQDSGQPGADEAQIFVRGVGSLTADGAAPLILVDGVERSFSQMDPNEIASINVLKDASATAVFGVRGANGVILVTTRRGEEGKAKISINSSVGVQMPTRILEIADSYAHASAYSEMQRAAGVLENQLAFSAYDLERFRLGDEPIMYPNVDWYDYLMNKAAVQTQHNVNISGGTKDIRYFVSLGFLYQDGLFKKLGGLDYDENYKYSRYNYRANLDVNLTPTTVLQFNMGGIIGSKTAPKKGIWGLLSESFPMASPGVIDGHKVMIQSDRFPGFIMDNQIMDGYYGVGYDRNVSNDMNFDLHLTQDLAFITEGLSFEVKGSYNTNYSYGKSVAGHVETYSPFYKSQIDGSGLDVNDPAFDKTVVYRISGQNQMKSYSEGSKGRGRNWYLEGSLRYNRKFGNHNVGALLLYNQSKKYYPSQFSAIPTAYVGLVGRITYDYKSKYMAEFNVGYNGSENFAPDKRFGTFPAGSVGYVITEENFFPKNDVLTYLKLRASIGLVGNDNMDKNRFLYLSDAYSIDDAGDMFASWKDKKGYIFGLTNTAYYLASLEQKLGNSDVSWETALKQNYGFDAYFFKDHLKLTVDYFFEKRRDILINRTTVPVLAALDGLLPVVNMGKVENKGYEVELKWSDTIKDFSYYVNTNMSYSRNKIIYQDEVEPNEPYMWLTGHEVGAQFGYVALGFYNKDDFHSDGTLIDGLPIPSSNKYPGDIKYADLNNDNVINADDQTIIGNPKRPRYTFGVNLGANYKGFFVSMNWAGATGCDLALSSSFKQSLGGGCSLFQFYEDGRWTEETAATAKFPRIGGSSDNMAGSSVWLKDGTYFKLKNLTIGYNVTNERILNAIGASKLAVQFTGYNLLTFDKLKFADPECNLSNANTYPITKIFSLGVNLTF